MADAQSPGDGMWWAITTVTTVGYGDVTPETAVGRLLAVAVMLRSPHGSSKRSDEVRDALARIENELATLREELKLPARAESGPGSR
jgi:voltage-gated potassium channel Kch